MIFCWVINTRRPNLSEPVNYYGFCDRGAVETAATTAVDTRGNASGSPE